MEIRFDYEYDCGGYTRSNTINVDKDTFENDRLLVLVCAYMNDWGGYPGRTIDRYLHNKFPNCHTLEYMYGECGENVYSCYVEGLKDFREIIDEMGMDYSEAESYITYECLKFNEACKKKKKDNENFSIWKD